MHRHTSSCMQSVLCYIESNKENSAAMPTTENSPAKRGFSRLETRTRTMTTRKPLRLLRINFRMPLLFFSGAGKIDKVKIIYWGQRMGWLIVYKNNLY